MDNKGYIGVDLGGTKISIGLFDISGNLLFREKISIAQKKGIEVVDTVADMIKKAYEVGKRQKRIIESAGIGIPGIYYRDSGKVWAPNIEGFDHFPLRQELEDRVEEISIKLNFDSDRACYILGETWKGAALGCKHAIFLAVGTGIGAGILIDGKVLRGKQDIAGAIGWMVLHTHHLPEGESVSSFESRASGAGMAKLAQQLCEEGWSHLSEKIEYHKTWSAQEVFKAWKDEDPIAEKVIKVSIEYWGMAVANLVSIFNPEVIIFGGGVFGPGVALLPAITEEAKKWAQPLSMKSVRIVLSDLGPDAGLYGAAYLAINQ